MDPGVLGTMEHNPELGIMFLMSITIKCKVSGTNVLLERTAGHFTRHYPKTLLCLATGWLEKRMLG